MTRRSLWSVSVATVWAGALLAVASGCGSSSEPARADVRAEIERTVRDGLTRSDPSWCETGATSRFLEQNAGEGDSDPVQQCRFQSVLPGDTFAHEVDFRSIRVDGDRAVVTVFLTGGEGDGSTLRIELIHADNRWKFDYNADIQVNRDRFDAAARKALLELGVSADEADCAVERLRRIYDTDELERAFVAGETDGYDAAQAICLSRASLIGFLDLSLRKGAPKYIPKAIIECISRRIAGVVSTSQLRAIFGATDELEGYLEGLVKGAGEVCAKDAEAGLLPDPSPS